MFGEPKARIRWQWLFLVPIPIEAYLKWAERPLVDWHEKRHNIFVEPIQDIEVQQKRFHVIIDLYSLSYEVKHMDNVSHEWYQIKRDSEGNLNVLQAKSLAVAQTLLSGTRHFTDEYYPWGSEGWDNALVK
ncbi:hypothetical protein BDV97DRAFT_389674 [Delphinella strobiligena]|nr:hypothetical protein BDV97DRAFT_389674 [Delphinella strobiligena]